MVNLRFRQIHLDFHTSEVIPGIGSEFDADEFADTLKAAHVNSVTCFSRCHHGMIYHDTAKFPERRHPNLTCNLLKEQIDACHARDIRVPIYITVQWDLFTVKQHPEWVVVDENGCFPGTKPFEAGFYRRLCLNSPYVDEVLEPQTLEVCETMPVDGFFFDIVSATPCCCQYCIEGMKADGLDPANAEHRAQYADKVLFTFQQRLFDSVRAVCPEATVFFNSGHCGPKHRKMINAFTHLELESLPSGGWGYMHFPLAQRFARGLHRDCMGMTGKFHTSWGDFHSFKNKAALEYECFNMLALGAKCSIGDQLHPTGKICPVTYDLIGSVYSQVEEKEPWCDASEPVTDVGVMTPEEFAGTGGHGGLPAAAIGATRMLTELRHQFDIIDSKSDFSRYRVIVMPDEIVVDDELGARLTNYVVDGGCILASYKSGLNPAGDVFNVGKLGVKYVGDAAFCPDFLVPGKLGEGLADTHYVMYLRGLEVEIAQGVEILSHVVRPYFNRTWEHFCSHRHTPAKGPAEYVAAVRKSNCIYFAHPVFTQYHNNAPLWCKTLVANALNMLLPDPVVKASGPSTAQFSLNAQNDESRLVLHALHYIPERRGRDFDIIEDVIPIYDVHVSVAIDKEVTAVNLVPRVEQLQFKQADGRVEFVIPRINGHEMVEIRWA
ncbi:MAG: beta-galactosidase trimerization domain-containing protein [Armatimonadetes bacterium]|nr:beta-galactosidase trimerization domain-containing protein [Armatimonadota bacterium]